MADLESKASADGGEVHILPFARLATQRAQSINAPKSVAFLRFKEFIDAVVYKQTTPSFFPAEVVAPRFLLSIADGTSTISQYGGTYTRFINIQSAARTEDLEPWYPTREDVAPPNENPLLVPPCETGPGSLRPTEGLIYPRRI